jgi:hypothetical protein
LDFAKKCTILVVNSTAIVPGWSLVSSSCAEREMTANYRRTYGTAEWIFRDARALGALPKHMTLKAADSAYNNVIGAVDIPMVKHKSEKPAQEKAEIQKALSDLFQSIKIDNFRFEDKAETVASPDDPAERKSYPYTQFAFTDVSFRLPLDWVNLMSGIKSIEITSIKWDNSTRKWTYEGKIYEKN